MPVISTNTAANSAIINLNKNSETQATYLQQISSGSRINSSSDDAAGLSVSGQLESDITTLEQSARNAQQAEALLQTVDGALARQADILQRMKSLSTQYNSGTVDDESREFINAEYEELLEELDLITTSTEFNGSNLIDGSYDQSFIVGIEAVDSINVDLTNLDTSATGLDLASSLTLTEYNITKASVETADGSEVTGATQFDELAASGIEVSNTGGTFVYGDIDFNGDGTLDVTGATITVAATDTIQDLLDGINAVQNADGVQVFDAYLENGQIVVNLNSGDVIDGDGNGEADVAFTITSTALTSTIDDYTANEVFDNLRTIDNAIKQISDYRSQVGAYTSAMEYQGENIDTQIENLTAAKSTIVDADIAEAQSEFTTAQVLTEAATAALAQANQLKTSLLTLLK